MTGRDYFFYHIDVEYLRQVFYQNLESCLLKLLSQTVNPLLIKPEILFIFQFCLPIIRCELEFYNNSRT